MEMDTDMMRRILLTRADVTEKFIELMFPGGVLSSPEEIRAEAEKIYGPNEHRIEAYIFHETKRQQNIHDVSVEMAKPGVDYFFAMRKADHRFYRRQIQSLRAEVSGLKAQIKVMGTPANIPLWKRISNQRREIRALHGWINILWRIAYEKNS